MRYALTIKQQHTNRTNNMTDLDRLQIYANDLLIFNRANGPGMNSFSLAIHNNAVETLRRVIVRGNNIPTNMAKLCDALITTDKTNVFFDATQVIGFKPSIRHAIAVERLNDYCANQKKKNDATAAPPTLTLRPPEPGDTPPQRG